MMALGSQEQEASAKYDDGPFRTGNGSVRLHAFDTYFLQGQNSFLQKALH